MNYRSCAAINNNFIVTEGGDVACPVAQLIVSNSMQRAYIFTNLFFYDITEREVDKLRQKIAAVRENVIASSGIPENAVERLFPSMSAQFKLELGDNSLDPLIKVELAKINRHLSLQLSKDEQKQLDKMREAICVSEIAKFKKSVIFTKDNGGKPYEVNFSEKYVNNLPERARRLLKPTIKMLAYMDGLQFATFEMLPNYQLTYTWDRNRPEFDEEKLKDQIKSVIAGNPDSVLQ